MGVEVGLRPAAKRDAAARDCGTNPASPPGDATGQNGRCLRPLGWARARGAPIRRAVLPAIGDGALCAAGSASTRAADVPASRGAMHAAAAASPAAASMHALPLLDALAYAESDEEAAALLARLSTELDALEPPEVAATADAACASGALQGLCAWLVAIPTHAHALVIMAQLTTPEVNPSAPRVKLGLKAVGALDPVARHLFSEQPRTVALACAVCAALSAGDVRRATAIDPRACAPSFPRFALAAALRRLSAARGPIWRAPLLACQIEASQQLQANGGTTRLRQLSMCDVPAVAAAAAGCLSNLTSTQAVAAVAAVERERDAAVGSAAELQKRLSGMAR